jgi:phospholipid transport system substrate-binding protein
MRPLTSPLRADLLRLVLAAALTIGALLASPAQAQTLHTADEAKTFIANLAQQAISSVAAKQISDKERNDRFRSLFVSAFDLPEISRFVLARYWRSASAEQQQDFIKLFEELQVLNWAQRFKDYKGEALQVTGSTGDGDQGFSVDTSMQRPSGQALPVTWKVHQGANGQLQVTDIIVEGVSMCITQRSDYNSLLQSNGGKFDALLAALRGKISQLGGQG